MVGTAGAVRIRYLSSTMWIYEEISYVLVTCIWSQQTAARCGVDVCSSGMCLQQAQVRERKARSALPTLRRYPGLSRITGIRPDGNWTKSRHSLAVANGPEAGTVNFLLYTSAGFGVHLDR